MITTINSGLLFILFLFLNCQPIQTPPRAYHGVIDLGNIDFNSINPVYLDGEWEFYWKKFRSDYQESDIKTYIQVPGKWNDFIQDGKPVGSKGYGLYRLKIRLPANSKNLALRYRSAEGGSRIFINGSSMELGHPGRSKEETINVRWQSAIIPLPETDSIVLEIDSANYAVYLSGLKNSLQIGNKDFLQKHSKKYRMLLAMVASAIFILGIYHLIYFFQYRKKAILYFALFFLTMGIRIFVFKEGLIYSFFPDTGIRFVLTIEYATIYLSQILFPLYLYEIFPKDFRKIYRNLFIASGSIFMFSLVLPLEIFTAVVQISIFISLVIILFIFYISVIVVYRKRPYARVFFASFMLIGINIAIDATYSFLYGSIQDFAPFRIILFALFQGIFISGNVMNQEMEKNKALENERRYRWMSFNDELTGLSNKRYFNIQYKHMTGFSQESGLPLSVILLDIDNFKNINDHYGHLQGDNILKEIGMLIIKRLRDGDQAFRFGGEEMILLLPGTDSQGAFHLAEQIRESIQNNVFLPEEKIDTFKSFFKLEKSREVTVSIGIAEYSKEESEDQLLRRADAAMYEAKKTGKNRTVIASRDIIGNPSQ